jgi:tripartite-type tricarboxylate transporter receptor subunit TctC
MLNQRVNVQLSTRVLFADKRAPNLEHAIREEDAMKSRRVEFSALAFAAAFIAASGFAQEFPSKPLRIIVPDALGGAGDLRSRQIGAKLSEFLGQPVITDNRPGGNMFIGAQAAARALGDGYTLFFGSSATHSTNPLLFKSLPYQPDEDFAPVTLVASGPFVLVASAQTPATSLAQFLALARERPGHFNYGAPGTPVRIGMEMVMSATGVQLVHVPYKSVGAVLQDLAGGRLHAGFSFWSLIDPYVKSGKLRALAVAGPRRLAAAPDVPTFAEAGVPGIEAVIWGGIFVPAGTPKPVVARLHAEIVRAINSDEFRNSVIQSGGEPGGNSPEEFSAYIRADRARWKKAVDAAGIVPE